MATPTIVSCTKCGNPYSARIVEGKIVLPTNDGRCRCGASEFDVITEASTQSETTEG